MKRILVMCLAVCFAVAGISGAASAAVKAGDGTAMGTLSYNFTTYDGETGGLDVSTFAAALNVGRFVTDSFQLEFGLAGHSITIDEGGSATLQQMGLQVRPNFHFNTESNTVPYIGLTLGYFWTEYFEVSDGNFLYGGQVGIKQFIKDNAYMQFEVGYNAASIEFYGEDVDVGDLRLSVGFGVKF
ncbi:MAG: hypothetical protein ABII89_03905 [Candidatus Omnitrophota bacterium]